MDFNGYEILVIISVICLVIPGIARHEELGSLKKKHEQEDLLNLSKWLESSNYYNEINKSNLFKNNSMIKVAEDEIYRYLWYKNGYFKKIKKK
jgi:hypothetical protein